MSKLSRLVLGLAAVGGLLLAPSAFRWTGRFTTGPTAAAQTQPPSDQFKRIWAVPVSGYRDAAISPDGQFVGILWSDATNRPERLSLWRWQKFPDHPLWTRAQPAASRVVVGVDGHTVMAYALMDPMRTTVAVRRGSDGAGMWDPKNGPESVDGAVWDLQMSEDGQFAGITTGGQSLYLCRLGYGDTAPRFSRWHLGGIGNSVAFTSQSTYLTTGTWDQSGVSCFALGGDGHPNWQYPTDTIRPEVRQTLERRLFETQIARNGRYVLGLSYANARRSDGTLYLWRTDGDGIPLWTHTLGINTFLPQALISRDGSMIAVTFVRMLPGRIRPFPMRSLRVLGRDGHVLWEKGDLFSSPTLLTLSADGHRITLSDGARRLYNINAEGRQTSMYTLRNGATIRQATATPDGHYLLVYTSDGWLNLFQIG